MVCLNLYCFAGGVVTYVSVKKVGKYSLQNRSMLHRCCCGKSEHMKCSLVDNEIVDDLPGLYKNIFL